PSPRRCSWIPRGRDRMPEAVQVIERTGLAHVNLRGDPGDGAFLAAVKGVLGADLPLAANTTVEAGGNVACWFGPDEWLVIADGDGAALARALRAALGGIFSAVTEVGGGNVAFLLQGEGVREVLARECPLDLDLFGN